MMLSSVGFEDKIARKRSLTFYYPAAPAINLVGDRQLAKSVAVLNCAHNNFVKKVIAQ
ncbi:MAG: hypothetical protein RLZZ04_2095 [Cyanobacteriota bacterium]|jgi:hypothetical protein